jgi:hypothetical protein
MIPATLDARRGRAEADLPPDATVWYLNFVDTRELTVSTEHEVMPPARSGGRETPPSPGAR